ncbi:thiamine diphosphokinase [Marinovum sp. 2_MG-2023]|nr:MULTISPECIES: thiamine diphosphokinase [unclassified Marinovum]MDO6729529.1 thiamine diphosphokinase [Marinovum sp. 2_MG-2023]MDO6780317.1 thiamine diphosphokinase [Marinovum sp. 1_MG-2023]
MIDPIVSASEPILLAGGGDIDQADVTLARTWAKRAVAADGGATALLQLGITPEAVIGDFDSLSDATKAALPADSLHHIAEQDSTDFDKCLRNISAPLILGLGFMGARVDHQLSVFNRLAARPNIQCILIGREDVVFHAPPQLTLSLDIGTRVSLFPMTAVTGASTGLRWPIDGLEFAPAFRAGTSNEADAQTVTLSMDAPGMLVILPRNCLNAAVRAVLAASTAPWNARA